MRVVFAGTPEVAVSSLEALRASGHEVVAVLTRPDAPRGRGKRLTPSPVAARAAELGIEVLTPRRPAEAADRLRELAPECVPVVAYGALIPPALLALPPHGWINLHFSLLPRWRGAAPVQHALMAGDAETGAVTFELVEELDAGPVYDTLVEPIGPSDTAGDLLGRLARSGAGLLVQTLDAVAAGRRPVPQPATGVTLAPKLTVEDARIDWSASVATIGNLVRGCSPAPGAWTTLGGARFKIISAAVASGHDQLDPGRLAVTKREVTVGTGDGVIALGVVQPPGKRPMPAADWARGASLDADERLGR